MKKMTGLLESKPGDGITPKKWWDEYNRRIEPSAFDGAILAALIFGLPFLGSILLTAWLEAGAGFLLVAGFIMFCVSTTVTSWAFMAVKKNQVQKSMEAEGWGRSPPLP